MVLRAFRQLPPNISQGNKEKLKVTTPIKTDEIIIEQLEAIFKDPGSICEMDDDNVASAITFCYERLHRFRMGGRSSCLIALSVLLWHAHERADAVIIDIEECLALAFRTAVDPTFIQSEWGIILAGVIIARYLDRLPGESKEEASKQARLLLRHLEARPSTPQSVKSAASALLQAWDASFHDGLDPVVKAGLETWPPTASGADISDDKLSYLMDELSRILPAEITERERMLYKLNLERQGKWQLFQAISLSK